MVMRNRHDGANAPGWWDDLPPGIKKRCAGAVYLDREDGRLESLAPFERTPASPARVLRDLSWLAFLFFSTAFGLLVFLLLAVSFLYARGLFGR
jgi:hypothetical protein